MFSAFILLLPAGVCLFWMLLYPLTIPKASTFKSLLFLTAATCLFFLADGCYASQLSTIRTLTVNSLITQLAAPSIIPLLIIYLRKIGNDTTLKHIHLIWILVPIILFVVELMMLIVYGADNIENYLSDFYANGIEVADRNSGYLYRNYYLWAVVTFRIVMAMEILALLINFLLLLHHRGLPLRYLPAFLYHKGNIQVLALSYATLSLMFIVCLIKMSFLRDYMLNHQWIPVTLSILLALLMFMFYFFGLFSSMKVVTLKEMQNRFSFDNFSGNKQTRNEHASSNIDIVPAPVENASGNKEIDTLLGKFQRIVVDQELFLMPQLTVSDVADRLATNKTYVSKLINSAYKMPFPDLINALRIKYAQRYIINHRHANQVEIAKASGFTSASALNNTFKKVTGMTPKIWLATHDEKHYS